ncbi:MAG: hypothetical protein O3C17_21740, partial [Planctomycetota bacterium]|nr:hypothetical protein [Planctomycetota bacterium]
MSTLIGRSHHYDFFSPQTMPLHIHRLSLLHVGFGSGEAKHSDHFYRREVRNVKWTPDFGPVVKVDF